MEPWTDGEPLIFKSELPIARELRAPLILKSELPINRELRGWSLGLIWGAPDFKIRTSYRPRTPRMEPWTDRAPLILKSELPIIR